MFGRQSKCCAFCDQPLPFAMFIFCCNECQRCWHRRNGSSPKNWDRQEFRDWCRQHREALDEHERKVDAARRQHGHR